MLDMLADRTNGNKPAVDSARALKMLDGLESTRHDRYRAYREYYDGEHNTQLTSRQRKFLQIKVGEEFNSNYCPIVVDALAERLRVTGFQTGEEDEEKPAAETIGEWCSANRFDALQQIVEQAAVRDGDAYVLVAWDNEEGRPEFTFEPAFDGTEGVEIVYNPAKRREPLFAFKRWKVDDNAERLNLYFPDRIEKYWKGKVSRAGLSQQSQERGDEQVVVSGWQSMGQPEGWLGDIPVVHFRNNDQGYNFGQSELRNVVPLQNALNKAIIDMVASADMTAFRILTMLGDDPGDLELVPGSWVYSEKPPGEVEIDYIPGEGVTNLIEFKDAFAMEIARVSRTPISYFQISKQRPAEGTLQQEEVGLVSRAKNRHVTFGNGWEDVMRLGIRLHNAYAPQTEPRLDEDVQIDTLWHDPQTRNDLNYLQTMALKKQLGIPLPVIWREMGYDEALVKEWEQEYKREQRRALREGARAEAKAKQRPEEEETGRQPPAPAPAEAKEEERELVPA